MCHDTQIASGGKEMRGKSNKLLTGFFIMLFFAVWGAKAANVTIPDTNLEIALREALGVAAIPGGPHGGSWLPAIPQGIIDDAALSHANFNIVLDISNRGISKLDGLEYCTNLTGLDASDNKISSLSYTSGATVKNVLGGLDNATTVDLSNNSITSLVYGSGASVKSVLEDLTNCTYLDLSKNKISTLYYGTPKVSVFNGLSALTVLNLNNNSISTPLDVSCIGVATALEELYLSNNKIAGVFPNLNSLTALKRVQLDGNDITDFSSLDATLLTALEFIEIKNNKIAPIYIRRINPTIGGETIVAEIYVGDSKTAVSGLFGISFKLHFVAAGGGGVTAQNGSVAGSLLGTTLNSNFEYPAPGASGDIQISVTKQSGSGVNGYGRIASVELVLDSDVTDVTLTFDDVKAINSSGGSINLAVPPLGFKIIAGDNSAANYAIVWPGDADGSGTVDQTDLTTMAAAFGADGPARANDIRVPADSLYRSRWFPQAVEIDDGVTNWTNAAEAQNDCNGDGIVDEADVLVLALNWGKTTASYTPPLAPSRNEGYSLPILYEVLRAVESMPKSEARDKMINVLRETIIETQRSFIPKETIAMQNFPNPFNPETWIPFKLAKDADVSVRIFDSTGRLVRNLDLGRKSAGSYVTKDLAAYWDGKTETGEQVSSGIYFYTVKAGDFSATKKMIILK